MDILLIRHGESEADILHVHEGRADFELTQRGHRQAEAMAEHVAANYHLDRIYCSTLKRARQTAEHLSAKTGVPVLPQEELMEFNNGLLAGLSREEADERYPFVPGLPIHQGVYGQESKLEFRFRAEYILSKIRSENGEGATVAIVTHGGMIGRLYQAFLRLPVDSDFFFVTGDTGIHHWHIRDEENIVVMANYLGHAEGI